MLSDQGRKLTLLEESARGVPHVTVRCAFRWASSVPCVAPSGAGRRFTADLARINQSVHDKREDGRSVTIRMFREDRIVVDAA